MTRRALVLGGGGPVGIAWEVGLIAGLAEAGVDLAAADFILGTSAGAFVGSQLAMGRGAATLVEAILAEEGREAPPAADRIAAGDAAPTLAPLFKKMQEGLSGKRDELEVRREIGAWALKAKTADEASFIKSFGRSLSEAGEGAWPARAFACTAVDAESGALVVWNGDSGVGLARAVASSCSVPGIFPPVTLNGRRYIDGGMRSSTSADLAAGYDVVVVLAIRSASADPAFAEPTRRRLEAELATIRDAGGMAELIIPGPDSLDAFGPNLMDGRRRPLAARAGLAQGRALAESLKTVWV